MWVCHAFTSLYYLQTHRLSTTPAYVITCCFHVLGLLNSFLCLFTFPLLVAFLEHHYNIRDYNSSIIILNFHALVMLIKVLRNVKNRHLIYVYFLSLQ